MASNYSIAVSNATTYPFNEGGLPTRAYVTVLAGNGDDWKGVEGLARGLRKQKCKYPLVVAVLPDVPEEHRRILGSLGCIVKEIQPVYCQLKHAQVASVFPYVSQYSKLLIWQFVEYSKMIYLEGDSQIYANIDFLFDSLDGHIHAPLDCFCTGAWSQALYEQWPESFKWPTELGPKPSPYFSANMFVFEPSISIMGELLNILKSIIQFQPIPFAEQHVLNMFFRKKLVPFSRYFYGALTMVEEGNNIDHLEEVMVIRYGSPEFTPWRRTPQMVNEELVNRLKRKWTDICHDNVTVT